MSAVTCLLAGWDYTTDDNDPVLTLTQLNLHAMSHTLTSTSTELVKQEPPKIERPKIWKEISEKEWNTFPQKWGLINTTHF